MTVSSRTPEGLPSRCPLCGAETNLEFSDPGRDAPCPNCGCLLWESTNVLSSVQRLVAEQLGVSPDAVSADRSFADDLGADSLDTVELVMELEEEFDINIPEEAAERIQTVRDAIRYILEQRRKREE